MFVTLVAFREFPRRRDGFPDCDLYSTLPAGKSSAPRRIATARVKRREGNPEEAAPEKDSGILFPRQAGFDGTTLCRLAHLLVPMSLV